MNSDAGFGSGIKSGPNVTPDPVAKILLREAVVADLDELATYIQKDNPQTAIRFLEAARETLEVLAREAEPQIAIPFVLQAGGDCQFLTVRSSPIAR
jgi:hypothetical protein